MYKWPFFVYPTNIQNDLKKLKNIIINLPKPIVFTNGVFDILHIGHVNYLREAREQGDVLVVGLNSDSSVRELKGKSRPIQHEEDRAGILAALQSVDFVVLFSESTPIDLIKALKPDVLVKGGDWVVEQIVGYKEVLANGGEVRSLQFVEGRSSSDIIERIQAEVSLKN